MPASPSVVRRWTLTFGIVVLLALVVSVTLPVDANQPPAQPPSFIGVQAPELDGGVAWLNTGRPLKLAELRGKIVMLDFWTLCCINCIHIMPDLAKLEEKYKNQLVVIGIHSPKFDNEKDPEALRKAVSRYELKHPVINDSDRKLWKTYGCDWWPTIVIIDPDGKIAAGANGETNFTLKSAEAVINTLITKHRKNKTLDETPVRFDTAKFRDSPDTPLYFPGKVVADVKGQRLLIADSTHHRIVVTDLDGKKIAIAGTGQPGKTDGPFDKAQFDDPQGMAVRDDTVYLADRKNNLIRVLDLKTQTVRTVAGTARTFSVPNTPRQMECTPWDVFLHEDRLFVSMAGSHQIWTLNTKTNAFASFAGTADENIEDGERTKAKFAQPSGLASDGRHLFVADSETSSIRTVLMDGSGPVQTLVGRGLFVFGDRDGPGRVADPNERMTKEALLQHAVGVAYHPSGRLFVADTYNSKIKTIELRTGMVETFVGGPAKAGEEKLFNEPYGLSIAGDTLYVADTNAHRIRVVDIKTKTVKTLELKDVPPVEEPKTPPKK